MTAVTGIPPYLMRKFIVRTTVWIVFLAIVLFGAAGTIRWTPGWIYIGFLAVMSKRAALGSRGTTRIFSGSGSGRSFRRSRRAGTSSG